MTDTKLPTPPAGTRWREEKYTTTNGVSVVARYANGWQCLYNNGKNWVGHGSFHQLCVADADLERVWSLRTTPTEPLPAPVVDRSGEAWRYAARFMDRAVGYKDAKQWGGTINETDTLLLALAPHWRELAALAGEAVPKLTVLEGWYNVYDGGGVGVKRSTKAEAENNVTGGTTTHVAVRLAVVEDAV